MNAIISAKHINKRYGKNTVLSDFNLEVERGKIVGLIGPNGAGKTTALKCLLGLAPCEGELTVAGINPQRHRAKLMQEVCFIADTAILPRWLNVGKTIDFLEHVHPKFNRAKAEEFLSHTSIDEKKTIGQLSKGMITQLHLALIMAIDVQLLILDEPTLGLDLLYRKQFYTSLLNDYFDQEKTIVITTHQVEEVESLLTDLLFIRDGKIVLDSSMDDIGERFVEVYVKPDQLEKARVLSPIYEQQGFGNSSMIFDGTDKEQLKELGDVRIPSIADIFVATMQ